MNRREMKKQVKKTIASFALRTLPRMRGEEPDFSTDLMSEIMLDVFRDGYVGTQAERRRLESILYEMHREAHEYEV